MSFIAWAVWVVTVMTLATTACAYLEVDEPAMPTPCPAVTPVPAPIDPKLIVALVDCSISYQQYTKPALAVFVDVLPLVVSPGDHVIAAWIGSDSYGPLTTFFSETVPPVKGLVFDSSPRQPQKPSDADPIILWAEYEKQMKLYYCETAKWNNEVKARLESSQEARKSAVQEFLRKTESLRDLAPAKGHPTTGICEALRKASELFSSPIYREKQLPRKLLIFSDMMVSTDEGIEQCGGLKLAGVDVLVAMFVSPDPSLYVNVTKFWEKLLRDAGVSGPVDFLRVEVSTPDNLAKLLLR